MSRVLITGGGGFIGRHTTAKLVKAGHEVIVAQRTNPNIANVEFAAADLCDVNAIEALIKKYQPSGLIHMAWTTEHGKFWDDPKNGQWLEAGKILLDRFFEHGGKRAVLAGSCAEYDWSSISSGPIAETAPLDASTYYGQCKTALFDHVNGLTDQGASIAWGRLFFLLARRSDSCWRRPAGPRSG